MATEIRESRLRHALELASTQGGAVSAGQLRTILHPREISAAMAHRILVRLWRGMYAVGSDQSATAGTRLAAAELTLHRPIVPCLDTAAEVHGFLLSPCSTTHVRTDGSSVSLRSELVVHRYRPIAAPVVVDGLTVEDAGETAVRLAAQQDRPSMILAVLDAALHSGAVVSVDRLHELATLLAGRGVRHVRQLAPLADGAARTWIDSWVRWLCLDRWLDVPEIDSCDGRVGAGSEDRFDFWWPRYMVAATLVPVDDPRLRGGHVRWIQPEGCGVMHLLLESVPSEVDAPETGPIHPAAVDRLISTLVAGRHDRVWATSGPTGVGSVAGQNLTDWSVRRPLLRTGGTPAGMLVPRVDFRPPRH